MTTKPDPIPCLKWRSRKSGPRVPYWIAPSWAQAKGYPVKVVNLSLFADDEQRLRDRCADLTAQAHRWGLGVDRPSGRFDGTFGALLRHYETDPKSSFHRLKPSSRRPYSFYLPKLATHIGELKIADCDGRDVMRWFGVWSRDGEVLAAANTTLAILKAATSFGIVCRLPGCADFKAILSELRLPSPSRRTAAPTADQVIAVRRAAHERGAPSRALAYAVQFEAAARQWDVFGQWVPLSDPRPSALIHRGRKWIGPTWSQIDDDLIFTMTPSKTERSTGARVLIDFQTCPMILEELQHWPPERRVGPLIVCEWTGLPYYYVQEVWRKDAALAGLPRGIWNRDLRAGGITEGGMAGASLDDRAKVAGHASSATTGKVYDRSVLEAQRRVARARTASRGE
jgi:integrase